MDLFVGEMDLLSSDENAIGWALYRFTRVGDADRWWLW